MNAVEDDLSSDMQFVAFKKALLWTWIKREHRIFLGDRENRSQNHRSQEEVDSLIDDEDGDDDVVVEEKPAKPP